MGCDSRYSFATHQKWHRQDVVEGHNKRLGDMEVAALLGDWREFERLQERVNWPEYRACYAELSRRGQLPEGVR